MPCSASKLKNFKVRSSFYRANFHLNNIIKLTLNITDIKTLEKYLVLNASLNSKITNKMDIEEKTNNAIIYETLTEEEKNRIDDIYQD